MNRWLHKLTKKEIWQLHHDVICEDSLKNGNVHQRHWHPLFVKEICEVAE